MKKLYIALALIAGLALTAPLLAEVLPHTEKLVIETKSGKKHAFTVEIADTPQKSEQGLMFRKSMPADHGMLFEFDHPMYAIFWMKNTLISLDILYVGEKGDIVSIAANTKPESLALIPAGGIVTGAIELNGGTAGKLGIARGDKVIHPFFKTP